MDIPYDLIHKLENKYGTMSNVPENNATLIKIRNILWENESLSNIENQLELENKVIQYVSEGYNALDIAKKTNKGIRTIRGLIKRLNLKLKPQFNYVAINKDTGQKIFSSSFKNYEVITKQRVKFADSAKIYLYKKGYVLREARGVYRWKTLKNGDQYFSGKELCTKC